MKHSLLNTKMKNTLHWKMFIWTTDKRNEKKINKWNSEMLLVIYTCTILHIIKRWLIGWIKTPFLCTLSLIFTVLIIYKDNIDHINCLSGRKRVQMYEHNLWYMLWLHIVHTESLCYPGKVFTEWFDGLQGFSCGDWFHMACSHQTLSLCIKCKKMADFCVNFWTLLASFLYSSKPFSFINLRKGTQDFINYRYIWNWKLTMNKYVKVFGSKMYSI